MLEITAGLALGEFYLNGTLIFMKSLPVVFGCHGVRLRAAPTACSQPSPTFRYLSGFVVTPNLRTQLYDKAYVSAFQCSCYWT